MNIYLNVLFVLVLLFIYCILIYRVFVKRSNQWLRENVGLTVLTMILALSSAFSIQIKSFIIVLSCGFLIMLIYRKMKFPKS